MTPYDLGEKRVDWVFSHMPVLQRIRADYARELPFKGLTVAICLHLEPKTANLGLTIKADLTGSITPAMLGHQYEELRRRRVIIDAPPNYS